VAAWYPYRLHGENCYGLTCRLKGFFPAFRMKYLGIYYNQAKKTIVKPSLAATLSAAMGLAI
jgi:hypothetical protein